MIVGPSEELLKIKRDEYLAEEKHNIAKMVNLRDQFAMAALGVAFKFEKLHCASLNRNMSVMDFVERAYDVADAMMEVRNAKD